MASGSLLIIVASCCFLFTSALLPESRAGVPISGFALKSDVVALKAQVAGDYNLKKCSKIDFNCANC